MESRSPALQVDSLSAEPQGKQPSLAFVVQLLSHVRLFATSWTKAYQAPLSSTVPWSLLKFLSIELVMLSCVHACEVASVVSDSATLQTVGHQAPLSVGFSRQEHWSGLPLPPPGLEPASLMSPALVGGFFTSAS